MNSQNGFTLAEVLIALLLCSSAALAIIQQQWQSLKLYNQLLTQSQQLNRSDNQKEQLRALLL